jgi:hypothetical protein
MVKNVSFGMAGMCCGQEHQIHRCMFCGQKSQIQHGRNVLWSSKVRFNMSGMCRGKNDRFSIAGMCYGQRRQIRPVL